MVLLLAALAMVALGGDLNDWGGQPWGSTAGGPKDPTARVTWPTGLGQVALMQVSVPVGPTIWLGIETTGGGATYYDGGLAQVAVGLVPDRVDDLLAKLAMTMGEPFSYAGGRVFEDSVVTVEVNPSTLVITSVEARARCREMFAASCLLRPSKAETEALFAQANELERERQAAMLEAERKAVLIRQQPPVGPIQVTEADLSRPALDAEFGQLKAQIATHCSSLGRCKRAMGAMAVFLEAHPEYRQYVE